MKELIALILITVFCICLLPVDSAHAGWKENYREKYSKQNVKPGSAEEKRIRTLANMDFTYNKNWNYGSSKQPNDTFQGYSTNFTPANMGLAKAEPVGEPSGRTLKGIIQDMGHAIVNPREDIGSTGSKTTK